MLYDDKYFFESQKTDQLYKLLINSLLYNKILDWSKLKVFPDDMKNENEKLKFGLGRVENIVRKGENAVDFKINLTISKEKKQFQYLYFLIVVLHEQQHYIFVLF